MHSIDRQLQKIKQEKRTGIMTHVIVGYPSLAETTKLVKLMAESGVDFVELQIPFSDPLADGPTIMKACEQSLAKGTKVKDAFVIMKHLTSRVTIPLLFMAYYNTVFAYGVEQFCRDAKSAGASGLIVPDMPIDEEPEEHFFAMCRKYQLYTIHVISPASTAERLQKNAAIAKGFIYCTARQGITGVKETLSPEIASYLKKVRSFVSLPIAVGFGISKKEHVKAVKKHADIVVVGSKIIDIIDATDREKRDQEIAAFITSMKHV